MSNQLPIGWRSTTLGSVCTDPQYGYTTKASDTGSIKLLRTTDITSGKINWSTVPFCDINPGEPEKYLLEDGDIVISRAGSVGVSYLLKEPEKAVFASYLIRFKPLVDIKFFKYFLDSPIYWSQVSENKLGIAVPNVNASKLKEISFDLPPRNEQNRIVTKIEELFSELDNGIASLKTAQEKLKVYRQAVLKHAFEGKLTAQWREENKDKLETPEQLLARIQQEHENRYQEHLAEWEKAVAKWEESGKEGKKPGKPKEFFAQGELDEDSKLNFDIPNSWSAQLIGHVFSVFVGATPSRKESTFWNGDIHWVSSGEVSFCEIHKTSETITQAGYANTSTETHPSGTVLLAMIGEGKTRGQAAILKIPAAHNQNTAAIRVSEINLSPEYLYYFFRYQYERTRQIGSGNNQKALNKHRVASIIFPLCSKKEQEQIVLQLEEKLSVTEKLDIEITNTLIRTNMLRQSILKKAFSGQLVPQDSSDEPASELLARIQAEKAIVQEQPKPAPMKRCRKVKEATNG